MSRRRVIIDENTKRPIKIGKGLLWYLKHDIDYRIVITTEGEKIKIVIPILEKD